MFGPLEEQSLAPGFYIPPNSDYDGYHAYVDEALPPESPYLYGLHPNAEIEFLTMTSENVFRTVLELQPRDSGASGGSAASRDDKVSHNALFLLRFHFLPQKKIWIFLSNLPNFIQLL